MADKYTHPIPDAGEVQVDLDTLSDNYNLEEDAGKELAFINVQINLSIAKSLERIADALERRV